MSKLFITLVIALSGVLAGVTIWHNKAKPPTLSKNGGAVSSQVPALLPSSKSTAAPKDDSELDLALTGNASMLLSDSVGRHTGRDPVTGRQVQEIPNSAYFEDSLSGEVGRSIEIPQPQEGQYQVAVTALGTGPYRLSIRAFFRNGDSQPELVKNGSLVQGSTISFILHFTSTPGDVTTLK
jgi:hypothetical protein